MTRALLAAPQDLALQLGRVRAAGDHVRAVVGEDDGEPAAAGGALLADLLRVDTTYRFEPALMITGSFPFH